MMVVAGTAPVQSWIESDTLSLADDPRWQLAQRIAASEIFSRSEFLPKFLLYICKLYLLDQTEEIREQNIGVRVFGRPPTYNPGDDNVVRNYAVQLRKRLNLYFEHDGKHEPFRIEIPRGGYVPVFVSSPLGEDAPTPSAVEKESQPAGLVPHSIAPAVPRRADWRMFFFGMALGGLLLSCIGYRWLPRGARSPQPIATNPLWSALFSEDRDTFIVPADAGLGILQNLAKEPANLTDYVNGEYLTDVKAKGLDQGNLEDLRTQRYTSMVDLNITSRLTRLPEVVPDHLIVRFARDLRMDDLKDSNVIMLGAIHTDPWVGLLQGGLNFQFVCGKQVDDCYIVNSRPATGEAALYRSDLNGGSPETYAILALLPNLDRNGWILLIEGLNMAGTEAAANMLLDDGAMRPLIGQSTSFGEPLKPFELLIRTRSLGAQALPSQIVARRLSD
jgi:hypothetical protein